MDINIENKTFKQYLFFWIGQIFSIFGSSVVFFVLVWWITDTTEDPIAISFLYFTYFIPMIIVSPIAGIVSDRYDRKKVIILADSLQAFSTFVLILFFMFNILQFWSLLIFTALRSTCQAFHMPTANAIIPTMVPKDKLSRINGINFLLTSFVNVVGPVVGGFLLIFFTVQQALWIDIITFLIALVPLLLIPIPHVYKLDDMQEKQSFLEAFRGGMKTIYKIPGLFSLLLAFAILNFFSQPRSTLLPYFIKVDHGGSVLDFSLVSMAFNIGIFIGGIFTTIKKNWKHKMRTIYFAFIIGSVGYLLLGIVPTGFILLIMFFAPIIGFSLPFINSLYFTIIQLKIPHDKIGRVLSIDITMSFIAMPLGTIIAGPLANIMGTGNLFLICAVFSIIIINVFFIFTKVRTLDAEEKILTN